MSDRVSVASLHVDRVLYDFINKEALPGTGVTSNILDWHGRACERLRAANRELLATRDFLQKRIDEFHRTHASKPPPVHDYKRFLHEIGDLVPEVEPFTIRTGEIDCEIATIAGPQLVEPLSNARYALNAANARWGSLYDALYGTDAIPDDGGATRGSSYNKIRGERVIVRARELLDEAVPLAHGSHKDVVRYTVSDGKLVAFLKDGARATLKQTDAFIGLQGAQLAPKRDCSPIIIYISSSKLTQLIQSAVTIAPTSPTWYLNLPLPRLWTWKTAWLSSTRRTKRQSTEIGLG